MSISGADFCFLKQICIDKAFLNDNDQVQEQTANILGKVSESNWSDIQPDNQKLLFFACRQYLGVCLQRQVDIENLLATKIEKTQHDQSKDLTPESDDICKSPTSAGSQRRIIEDAIDATSDTLSYVLFHDFSFLLQNPCLPFLARSTVHFLKSKTRSPTKTSRFCP